jgi:DNA-binding PadR family transcriptional regulator
MKYLKKKPPTTLTEIILDMLGEGLSSDLATIFLGNYSASYKMMRRKLLNSDFKTKTEATAELERRLRFNFYSTLSYLRKQGFIEKKQRDKKGYLWHLTSLGREKLKILREKSKWLPRCHYEVKKDNVLKIIIFDIPEKERFKRVWLRRQLLVFNFRPLQKSVWIGKNKLPGEFMVDLHNFDILQYIHIFHIRKSELGALRKS